MNLTGLLTNVHRRVVGAVVEGDTLSGATDLEVANAADLSPTGGDTVIIDNITYTTTAVSFGDDEGEPDVVTITPGLAADIVGGEYVQLEPYSEQLIGLVHLLDSDEDAVEVIIPHALADKFETGIRDEEEQETVEVDIDVKGRYVLVGVVAEQAVSYSVSPGADGDGVPPDSSPAAIIIDGIGVVHVRWSAITNASTVTYAVHIVPVSTLADPNVPDFTPDASNKVGETIGTQFTIRTLADGVTKLSYDEEYAVRLVASDVDGASATPGDGAIGGPRKVDTEDVSANYGYFGSISVDQLTGGTFSAEATISGSFKTALAGQRVEIGSFGIKVYNSAGDLRTIIAPDQTMFRGDAEIDYLTVMLSAAFRGTVELGRGSVTTLEAGVTKPSTAPTAETKYLRQPFTGGTLWESDTPENLQWDPVNSRWLMTTRFSGNGYMYAFNAGGVYQNTFWHSDDSGIFWNAKSVMLGANYDQILTVRGHNSGGGNDEYKVWLGGAGAVGGVQIGTIPRFQEDVMPAVIRVSDDSFAVVERGDGTMVSASFAGTIVLREFQVWNNSSVVLLSTSKFGTGWNSKTRVTGYYEGMADLGGDRVLFGLDRESTGFFQYRPFLTDGSGANDSNNDFPYPDVFVPWHLGGTKACGLAWDGSNFWTLGSDHALYKHEANMGDTTVSALSDVWWVAHTWHTFPGGAETDVGEARSFTMPRRSRVTLTSGVPQENEPGDPNGVGFYLARQAVGPPARTALWRQGLQLGNTRTVETPVLTGTNPPATNGYTDTTPALIQSRKIDMNGVDRTWKFSGGGTAKVGMLTVAADGTPGSTDTWHEFDDAQDPLSPTVQTGQGFAKGTGDDTPYIIKDGAGTVHIVGKLTTGNGTTHALAFPQEYWPNKIIRRVCRRGGSGLDAVYVLQISPGGNAYCFSYGGANNTLIDIGCSYTTL